MVHLQRRNFDTFNFHSHVLRHKSDKIYITMYANDLTLYEPPGHLIVTTVLALEKEFEVTNMEQLNWLLGIQFTYNCESIELLQEAVVNMVRKGSYMNDSNLPDFTIDPNAQLMMEYTLLEADYQMSLPINYWILYVFSKLFKTRSQIYYLLPLTIPCRPFQVLPFHCQISPPIH
jgi:hypothetical protein